MHCRLTEKVDESETIVSAVQNAWTVIMNLDKVDAPANYVLMAEASNFVNNPQFPVWMFSAGTISGSNPTQLKGSGAYICNGATWSKL